MEDEYPTREERTRALGSGIGAFAATLIGLVGVMQLGAALGLSDRWHTHLLRAVFVLGDAALICAVWQLGRARNRQWDLRGWAALVTMLVVWPTLLFLITWTAIAFVVWFTGQPFQPYGK